MAKGITIVGLGPGDAGMLTRQAWDALEQAGEVYVRTDNHPTLAGLPAGLQIHSFDEVYERAPSFEAVYDEIAARLLELAQRGQGVLYAVPGDPAVGEATLSRLREGCTHAGLPLRVLHGVSFVEPCLELLGVDLLDGMTILDAFEVAHAYHPPLSPDLPALLGQLSSRELASDVKLTLMNQYPADHRVTLIHAAGGPQAGREDLALAEMDHSRRIDHLTSLYIPPLARASAFETFQNTVAHLRAPDGCPWDREQTHASLRAHLLEEAYEALQALDEDDLPALREELGDLLLQIVLHAQIATEEGAFTMADVLADIQEKILSRHPHVFGDIAVEGVGEVLHNWEALKESERAQHGGGRGLLDGVPMGLPALAQALEIQDRVARVGFDWPEIEGVLAKIAEELGEVRDAEDGAARADELGDLLFAVVNYARWLKVDPEAALREANRRFRRRFHRLEKAVAADGKRVSDLSIDDLERYWAAAKAEEGA